MNQNRYQPLPRDQATLSRLLSLKKAAAKYACSADTLRNNVKSGDLRGYQQKHGTPIMLDPEDVSKFLSNRPNIKSSLQPDPAAVAPPIPQSNPMTPHSGPNTPAAPYGPNFGPAHPGPFKPPVRPPDQNKPMHKPAAPPPPLPALPSRYPPVVAPSTQAAAEPIRIYLNWPASESAKLRQALADSLMQIANQLRNAPSAHEAGM